MQPPEPEPVPLSMRRGSGRMQAVQIGPPPARAFWFGPVDRPRFGWYHAPAEPPRAVVVLCSAFGHEAMVTHRTYRRFAQRLASEGFAALRFDYDGTGDSAGNDTDPVRVQSWLDSVQSAVREAMTLSGTTKVILFGMRLGALLATAAAAARPVNALLLFAPPRSGKAWLREMRALQAMKNLHLPQVPGSPAEAGVAGFSLDDTTRTELTNLDFNVVSRGTAEHALIVARDDLPGGETDLVQRMADAGIAAELCSEAGYGACMSDDPFKSNVPFALFDTWVAWLHRHFEKRSESTEVAAVDAEPSASRSPTITTMALPTDAAREQVVDVGGLFGILSEPVAPSLQTRVGILLLNIGANHHIGSNRLYVRMARTWAALGFHVLRMDFSGMGDSPALPGGKENDVYAQRFMAEARSGVDFLQAQGVTRFALMGLCSGAYVSYHTAIADPRVSGLVMINPLTFHWTDGDSLEVRLRSSFKSSEVYKKNLFRMETWLRIARGDVGVRAIALELGRRTGRRAEREAKSMLARLTGEIAEATDIHRGFRQLCARSTQCLLVFGSEDGGIDVIEEHLGRDASEMRHVPGFKMEVLRGPDHTFTPLWTQSLLIELLTGYLTRHFGGDVSAPASLEP